MKKPYASTYLKLFFAFIFILLLNFTISAQNVQEKLVNGNFQKTSLEQFFRTIEKDYGIHFYYKTEWVKSYVINQTFKDMPLIQVLNLLFDRQTLTFKFFQNNSVVIFPKGSDGRNVSGSNEPQVIVIGDPLNEGRYATAKLKGKILDGKNSEPLVGAVIFHPQTGIGTTTNASGIAGRRTSSWSRSKAGSRPTGRSRSRPSSSGSGQPARSPTGRSPRSSRRSGPARPSERSPSSWSG